MRWTPNYHVACDIQRKLIASMDKEGTTAAQLAQLSNAWEKLEERKRILRMKPAPKPIDVPVKPEKGARTKATFSE